jgi:hypothetical protein
MDIELDIGLLLLRLTVGLTFAALFAQNGGYEYALIWGVAALTFAFTGPNSLSVDAPIGYSVSGALSGVVALFHRRLPSLAANSQGFLSATVSSAMNECPNG